MPPVDAEADIIVSEDEQSAYLGIQPPKYGGKDLTYAQLVAALEKKRVMFGVKNDVVQELANKPQYNTMVLVAQGVLPVQGSDARLEYHFSQSREIRPRERADGTVDYRDLGLIVAVTEGQKLVTLTPAVKGTPGRVVSGRVLLPDPVRAFGLPAGKNTKLSEDRLVLLAASNGSVEVANGKVHVNTVFTLSGNVCPTTGNINFDGTVVINGNVQAGFSVKAMGSITVVGNVEGAVLDAGGDIRIVAGLVGQGRGRAICGGSFKAVFVENAEVYAHGDVTADVFMHSQVRCGGSLIAEGRRGAIVGGAYVVGRDVKALTVGSSSGVPTSLELGVDPTVMEKMKVVKERIRVLDAELGKLNQIINLLNPMMAAGKLQESKADMLEKAIATKESHGLELVALAKERDEYTTLVAGAVTSQFICRRELYYGTKVTICQVPYTVPNDVSRCKIYLSPSKEITVVSI